MINKDITIINLNFDRSDINPYLSNTLLNKIEQELIKKQKILLYINRRWEFSSLVCNNCNFLYKCPNCDISLNIHKRSSILICHHCTYTKNIDKNCTNCNSNKLKKIWVWSQQIENHIKKIFKNNKVLRLDSDSIKTKSELDSINENIKSSDIIIWTNILNHILDIEDIKTVWIILIEQELQIPYYNSSEKLFISVKQLINKKETSEVLIQSYIPENENIKLIVNSNYKDFLIKTLKERKKFNYPPYKKIANIEYKNMKKEKSLEYINKLKTKLDSININSSYEITMIENYKKRNNQFFSKIIIKWNNIRKITDKIKYEIIRNKDLSIRFEN